LADEVQVGFARAGEHFWAFEQQGVVPDILTIGKPIANGHPMGAVITRPEIAQAFITGMEYFNTFAGNPVSCAIALSVLDVIREEKLQENAQQVGQFIMQGLRGLQTRFPIIGDVRGTGLFIGAELITDPDSKGVPTAQAHDIIETMKSQGILLSLDGPLNNVLKIKPPIVIQRSHAEQFLDTLETTLRIVTS
jgi:4-aminobutyrate aminotransferase-like enzyme